MSKIYDNTHFDILDSEIKEAGKGLFSKVEIKRNETIGQYTGIVITDKQALSPRYCDSKYMLWVCKDWNIIGEGPLANHTRYINHHEKPNAEIVSSSRWKKARIRALKDIPAGQEIFIHYGEEYWESA